MKKALLSTFFLAFLMTSCIQDCGNNCNQECKCPKNTVALLTTYINIPKIDWKKTKPTDAEQYTYASVELPEITKNVIDNGMVIAYFLDGQGNDNILPYIFPLKIDEDTVMQNIRYDIRRREITFIIETSDMGLYLPSDTMRFKVSVLSPN